MSSFLTTAPGSRIHFKATRATATNLTNKSLPPNPFKYRCRTFVENPAPNAKLSIGAYTLIKLKRCFSVFKAMVLDGRQALGGSDEGATQPKRSPYSGNGGPTVKPGTDSSGELGEQVRKCISVRYNSVFLRVWTIKLRNCACGKALAGLKPWRGFGVGVGSVICRGYKWQRQSVFSDSTCY